MDLRNSDHEEETISIFEAAKILGRGVSVDNVHARLRRGTLRGYKDDVGRWRVYITDLHRVLDEVDNCSACDKRATSLVVIKLDFIHSGSKGQHISQMAEDHTRDFNHIGL